VLEAERTVNVEIRGRVEVGELRETIVRIAGSQRFDLLVRCPVVVATWREDRPTEETATDR
jgi:hypothetical protein